VTRSVLNFLVDLVGLLAMLGMLTTGLVVRYVLPPGSRGGHGLELWGLDRHQWGDIHFWLAIALLAMLVLHVALHWDWVCAVLRIQILRREKLTTKPSQRIQNLAGVAFLGLLAALTLGFLYFGGRQVVDTDPGGSGAGGGHRGQNAPIEHRAEAGHGADLRFSGRMTLADAAAEAGVDVQNLMAALGLPSTVDPNERIGRLRNRYGFTMSDVRAAAAGLSGADDEAP
jgi:hypothetical protein